MQSILFKSPTVGFRFAFSALLALFLSRCMSLPDPFAKFTAGLARSGHRVTLCAYQCFKTISHSSGPKMVQVIRVSDWALTMALQNGRKHVFKKQQRCNRGIWWSGKHAKSQCMYVWREMERITTTRRRRKTTMTKTTVLGSQETASLCSETCGGV